MGEHAKYAPSSAYRWLKCLPSLEYPEIEENPNSKSAAEEGTMLHQVAYLCSKYGFVPEGFKGFRQNYGGEDRVFLSEHEDLFDEGLKFLATHRDDDVALFEHRVSIDSLVAEQFGTLDNGMYDGNTLYIFDWKFGRVSVSVNNNEQLTIYAHGVWVSLGRPECDVVLMIAQPRVTNKLKIFETDHHYLAAFEAKLHKYLSQSKHQKVAGPSQCKYCPGKFLCNTFSKHIMGLARKAMAGIEGLTTDEKVELMLNRKLIEKTLQQVEEQLVHAYNQGEQLEGLKLVEGVAGRRVYSDEDKAEGILNALIADGILSEGEVFNRKLRTPTQILKALGSDSPEELNALITQQQNSPKLVGSDEDGKALAARADDFDLTE